MSSAGVLVKVGIALLLVVGGGFLGYERIYAGPRRDLVSDLEGIVRQNERVEGANARIVPLRREIRVLARDALGGSLDRADHALRTALAAMASEAGVTDVTIASEQPRGRANPYLRAKGTNRAIRNLLKNRADFATISASIKASGSLDQALRLVALAQSQGWLHRVVSISLKPADKERLRFDVDVRTQSLYMPDLVAEARVLVLSPMDPLALDRITPIAMKNVFRYVPDAPVVPMVVAVVTDPPKPAAPAYDQWRLSGVARGRSGVEALLSNSSTGQWRTLAMGESILGARFLDGEPAQERAVFEIDGKLYEFYTNSRLDARDELPEASRPV